MTLASRRRSLPIVGRLVRGTTCTIWMTASNSAGHSTWSDLAQVTVP